jgi:hypothetical protein
MGFLPMKPLLLRLAACLLGALPCAGRAGTPLWTRLELAFQSSQPYANPLYDLRAFSATFTSPTGRTLRRHGFWDGGDRFKVRFAPDEPGEWTYRTHSSDTGNAGLHGRTGTFTCEPPRSPLPLFRHGALQRSPGRHHLIHADGTPFFFTACTAWNGALKSTDEEWDTYLAHRAQHHYNVIQFVTTQWRGAEQDARGEVAFTGSGRIALNPAFFQRLDRKVDRINDHGLIAAPVLLWALPTGAGRHLSPGYHLPEPEAILLARYLVARYGGHQVIWFLGGDGKYVGEYEQRWKTIGRAVFDGEDGRDHPGLVAQHPQGSSWIGEVYRDEAWLDLVGYQSSHSNGQRVVDWINKGPMATLWPRLPPRPLINLEPNYEEINFRITAEDVRNASWWSVFATPPAGITYGANGIWPWIQREGELIENHGNPGGKGPSTWRRSIDFPGSHQIGYLAAFLRRFAWWDLVPAPELLREQPGDRAFNHFISVVATPDRRTVLAYVPRQDTVRLRHPRGLTYRSHWYDPVADRTVPAAATIAAGLLAFTPPAAQDFVLVLEAGPATP